MPEGPSPSKGKEHSNLANLQEDHDLLENAPIGIYRSTPQGNLISANHALAKMFGYTSSQDLVNSIDDIGEQLYVYREDRKRFKTLMTLYGEVVNAEFQMRHRNGSIFWVSLNARLVRDENGNIKHYEGFISDITSRKKTEETLRETEERFSKAFKSSPAPLVISDINTGRFIDVNDRWVQMLGYDRKELLGRTSKEVGIWADPSERDRIVELLKHNGQFGEEPIEFITKSGNKCIARWSAELVTLGGREVMLSMIYDETERKMAEAEQEKLQAQLHQAQKMESVGILAGGVAHDFNNLLQAMGGNVELLLKDKPEDHPDVSRLKSLEVSIDRAAKLVRQLLIFSRKAEVKKQQVDLNHEIRMAVGLLERAIPKMINIELDLEDNIWPISADPVQIEQVLLNLGSNAADAMPQGGKLFIETSNAADDNDFSLTSKSLGLEAGPYILMKISDTGCGMSQETVEQIFDPFFTTKDIGKGTGLGLASVYGIIRAHDGHIYCSSEPGKGSMFKIYLPAQEEDKSDESKYIEEPVADQGKKTIMLVEDEPEIRELTYEFLESFDYNVYCADNGEQALEIYQEQEDIDLVLLDLNMPGMGGQKCFEELLKIDPEAKIIIVSGYSATGKEQQILGSKAQGFLSKPYQMRELASKIEEIFAD